MSIVFLVYYVSAYIFLPCRSWPVQVNLRAGNLKKELENVIVNSRLVIDGKGSSRYDQIEWK